jgi:hypothetical protein
VCVCRQKTRESLQTRLPKWWPADSVGLTELPRLDGVRQDPVTCQACVDELVRSLPFASSLGHSPRQPASRVSLVTHPT